MGIAFVTSLFYALFAYIRPLWAVSLFLFSLPILYTLEIQQKDFYFIVGLSALLAGIYIDLFHRHPVRLKRFLIKIRLKSIPLILIFLFLLSVFFGVIGKPLYNFYEQTLSINLLNAMEQTLFAHKLSPLYSLKSTFVFVELYLLGTYLFGIIKPSNQIRLIHHILVALDMGILLSSVIGEINVQWLVVGIVLLPNILLFGYEKRLYIIFVIILSILGTIVLFVQMSLDSLVIAPLLLFTNWLALYFMYERIHKKHEDFAYFFSHHKRRIFFGFVLLLGFVIASSFFYRFYIDKTFVPKETIALYKLEQTQRSSMIANGIKIFALNPLYGTGLESCTWKSEKLNKDIYQANLYISILIDTGLIGVGLFMSVVLLILYKLAYALVTKHYKNTEFFILHLIFFAFFIETLIYGSIQKFENFAVVTIFMVLLFLSLSLVHTYEIKKSQFFRASVFLRYSLISMFYLLLVHILNFTLFKKELYSFFSFLFPGLLYGKFVDIFGYLLGTVLVSIVISFASHIVMIFYSLQDPLFVDSIEKSHAIHTSKVPRAGGIGIYIASIMLVFNPIGWKMLIVSLPVFVIGLVDDAISISVKLRLFFQVSSAILALFFLDLSLKTVGLDIGIPSWIGLIIIIFALVGVTNAVNIIDGMNGLAGGVVSLAFLSIAYLSFILDDFDLFEVSVIFLVSIFGFLLLNFPKGKIFLGDSGTYLLGFSVATTSLLLIDQEAKLSVFYPIALMIYPIWEVLFSIYRRLFIQKKKSTTADRLHLHQLIFKRITRNNPKTTLYILSRLLPFTILTTLFAKNDILLLCIIGVFIVGYNLLYAKLVRGLLTKSENEI